MIDVKRKIHIDLVALYDLAYQNDLPEICGALSNVEHMVWELRRRDDEEYTGQCNKCMTLYSEDDLELLEDKGGFFKGCAVCKTGDHLMDLEVA
jgi:hypothetical protein